MDALALQRASLGELLDEIDAAFLEAGASKQVVHLRCTSVIAEVRRRLAPASPASVRSAPAGFSIADLAEQHADDKAQDPARLAAEARRLRARIAELEALVRADKPLPDPGAGTPEPHP